VLGASVGGIDARTALPEATSTSAELELRREGVRWLYLSGGIPLDTAGLPWAALGAGGRVSRGGRLSFGADLAAQGYGYRQERLDASGVGATLEALPFVALQRGPARLQLHAGARAFATRYAGESLSRSVVDAGARLEYDPDPRLSLGAESRWVEAAEGGFPYAGADAAYASGRLAAWAYAGRWLVSSIPTAVWGAGGSVAVWAGLRVEASLRQEAADPLYWNPARRYWSVGLARPLGGAAALRRPPAVAPLLPRTRDGGVVLRIPLSSSADAPSVAGDFNGWKPVRMTRSGDGWQAVIRVAPGVYHYSFRRPDGTWFVPDSIPARVDDGFGGVNAVLVVPAPEP
jgi:hypothetical protein